MHATEVASTHPNAPYDLLRPMLCRNIHQGEVCKGVLGEIDWTVQNTHTRKCQKCKAINVTHVHVHHAGVLDSNGL